MRPGTQTSQFTSERWRNPGTRYFTKEDYTVKPKEIELKILQFNAGKEKNSTDEMFQHTKNNDFNIFLIK